MIRTHLVKSLYENLLGPQHGPTETVKQPYSKYQIGILESCFHSENPESPGEILGIFDETTIPHGSQKTGSTEEVSSSIDNDVQWPDTEIDLAGSFTLGLSFVLTGESPKIKICSTWGRYVLDNQSNRTFGLFHRQPNFYLTEWLDVKNYVKESKPIKLAPKKGNVITKLGVELQIRSRYNSRTNKWNVQVFLINRTLYRDKKDDGTPKRQTEEDRVFQPQLRIKSDDDSIIDYLGNTDEEELLYHNNRTKVRGFQCSAIWREIDPEKNSEQNEFRKFTWIDSQNKLIPKQVIEDFTCPPIRTEYIPVYSIMQPEPSIREYNAEFFSNCWNFEKILKGDSTGSSLKSGLDALLTNYDEWITTQENKLSDLLLTNLSSAQKGTFESQGLEAIEKCKKSLKDIRKGVDFIRDDERARLAFCFMNSVMFENRKNNNRNKPLDQQLNWREFQMAFILQSLRGVAGFDKEEQNFADVLWFPTGGGKTEAYLGIIIFASAYRRLLDLDSSEESTSYNNDGGVCAISRYTLRLLTIQQFQRALGVFVVSDLKRVQNWIPKEMLEQSLKFELDHLNKKFLSKNMWGKTRFSIGLWIGSNSTPTRFAYMTGMSRGHKKILNAEGMLMSSPNLEKDLKNYYETPKGDPAQVTICPICENTLCLSNDEKLLDKKLTWIIQSNKNLETLQKIPKTDFQNTEVNLKSDPIFHELSKKIDGGYFFRVTMDISLKRKNPENIRKIIDEWWHYAVDHNFIAGDNSSLCSTRASMPGYFFLKQEGDNGRPYDFTIHCTNKECELNNTLWNEQPPSGNSNSIPKPFRTINPNVSLSVPISAYTVDEQIFAKCPTFIIATADKFAKLPWDPRCASLFGNVNSYHADFGYNRDITFSSISDCNVPLLDTKGKRKVPHPSELTECKNFLPPSLIVQDELHLIEGPLGSMVGIYEMAVDVLCRTKNNKPKYIASSATIKESKSQVGTLFRKDIRVFPQPGIFSDDNFFAKIIEDPSCARENSGGRLYLGLCSGKSTYDLPIKAMSIIMSEINKIQQNPELYGESEIDIEKNTDPYWTHISYFSDLQLMSRFTGFYSDDVQRDVEKFSPPRIGSENISGIITIPKGTYIIPITSDVDFSAWGVSVYCQSTGGNIAVALYTDDGHTKKLIWKSDQKRCEEGENIFSNNEKNTTKKITDEKITNIKKDTTVWIAIFTDSDGMQFDGINSPEPWFEFDSPLTTTKKIHQDPYSLKKEEKYEVNFPDILNTSKSCKIKNPIRVEITGKIRHINRKLPVTLSSETKSEDLPRHLKSLQIGLTKNDDGTINDSNTPDALLTSPVFGTGIDVDRLGLMTIMNQPKTTSGYIQASGRVGRKELGLVIAWLRARRARDLDHYENFLGYHRKIHSFVEPVTANPFSRETLELCLGPILVSILRNAKNVNSIPISSKWVTNPHGSFQILENKHGSSMDLESVKNILIEIGKSDHIPKFRRNPAFKMELISQITKWYNLAKDMKKQNKENLFPYGQTNPNKPASTDVVLGSPFHELRGKEAAFSNTKNSLRETESTAIFYSQLNTTAIRPSQFLTRYGPGSLLPTTGSSIVSPSISSMIVDLEKPIGNFNEIVDHKKQLNKIEILDSNMTKMLYQKNGETIPFNDIRIFNMPTNASLNSAEKTVEPTQTIYEAKLFPKWGICSNHKANTKIFGKIVYDPRNRAAAVQCPFCKSEHGNKYSTKFSSVRFVLACKAGHMSDVDWTNEIHSDSNCSHNDDDENRVFTWNESGGGDNIIFRCYGVWRKEVGGQSSEYDLFEKTTCNQETRYLSIKGKSIRGRIECNGKFVESNSGSERCSKSARLVLKSMMSLRSPAIISSLVIEQKKSYMFEKLSKEPLIQTFRNAKFDLDDEKSDWDGNDVAEKFIIQQKRGNIDVGDPLIRDIRNCTRDQLDTIYSELTKHRELIQSGEASLSEYENLAGELTSLENVMQSSLEGGSVQQGTLSKSIVFPIQWQSKISELKFEAMPFNDIKVTNVQTGYSREVENLEESDDSIQQLLRNRTGDMISKFSKHVDKTNDNVWYLGNQNLGEGIFIHLQPKDKSGNLVDAFSMFDETTFDFKEWNDHNTKISEIVEPLLKQKVGTQYDRDSNEVVMMRSNPLFVWWHSFAHQIITELAIDSGFTTTSLSERVYCIKKENGTFAAGILLYVSTPGSDGTLGGLTSLVDKDILPKIVSNAERHLLSCSNDPVCYERKFNPNRNRGAACHSCLMSPETTCSYQNKYLDRNLIRKTIEK